MVAIRTKLDPDDEWTYFNLEGDEEELLLDVFLNALRIRDYRIQQMVDGQRYWEDL